MNSSDRDALIKMASNLKPGSHERKAILVKVAANVGALKAIGKLSSLYASIQGADSNLKLRQHARAANYILQFAEKLSECQDCGFDRQVYAELKQFAKEGLELRRQLLAAFERLEEHGKNFPQHFQDILDLEEQLTKQLEAGG